MSIGRNLRLEVVLSAIDRATRPIRQVMGSSQNLTSQLKATKDQLKALGQTQDTIATFRQLSRDARETGAKLAGARQRVRELQAQMEASGTPTDAMARRIRAAQIAVEKLTLANRKQTDGARAARSALEASGISVTMLGTHERELAARVEATTRSMQQQEAAAKALSERQNKMRALRSRYEEGTNKRDRIAGAGGAMMAAGATTGAALLAPVKAFTEAEDSAVQLKVAMMNAGGKVQAEYGAVVDLAEKLGNQLPGTTAEFQDMMRILIQKGLDAKVVLGGAGEATAKLGVLTKVSFAESADAISVFQDSMRVADKDMVAAADQMQRLYNVGMKVSDIQEGFKAMGPALAYVRKTGIDAVKALGPLLAITDAAGMDAGSAGNAYNKIIRGSVDAKKTKKANEALKGTGIKLDFVDAKGNFAGIDHMVNQILKIRDLSDTKRKTVIDTLYGSDKEVAEALDALGKAGNEGIAAMRVKLEAQASLQERIGAQLGTLKNLWDAASGAFTNTLVRLGEAIAPELKALVEWIGNVSEAAGNWAKAHPELSNAMMKFAGILAITLTVLGALAIGIAGVLGPLLIAKFVFGHAALSAASLLGVFGKIGPAFIALGRLMLLNPVGIVLAAVAGAAWLVWRNWDSIRTFLMNWTIVGWVADHWNDIKAITGAVWQMIKDIVVGIGNGISAFFMNWTPLGFIVRHWESIRTYLSSLVAPFMTIGSQIVQGLVNGFISGASALKTAINGLGESAIGWMKEKLGIHSPSRVFAELGGFTIEGFTNGIANGAAGPLDAIKAMGQKLTAAGAGLALGTASMGAGAIPIDNRQPISAGAPATPAAPAAPINLTIHAAPGMNERELARFVMQQIEQAQRQQAATRRSRLTDGD
ncbi:phage tail tape measure protein [Laribacter hongkongensis]|uniref:phage tail tape measure protein n=1 Tax=Laribacter hongkongensis TaxID=168471 RepID=UPI001EFCAC0E|nr:phage tail tape measure protein [Laribacter hongkongensis]MCG9124276.1 phage tail tape measure protein [Laribacter hongkongensis]